MFCLVRTQYLFQPGVKAEQCGRRDSANVDGRVQCSICSARQHVQVLFTLRRSPKNIQLLHKWFAFSHSLLKSVLGKENWSISLRGNPPQGKLFEITQDFQRSLLAPREMDVTVSRCDAPNHFSLIYQITLRNCRESGKPWHILGSSLYFPIFIIPLPVKWWSNVLGWKSATCLRRKTRTCFSRCSLRRRTPARSPTRGRRPSSTATSSTSTTPTTWRFLSSPSIETSCSVFVHWF